MIFIAMGSQIIEYFTYTSLIQFSSRVICSSDQIGHAETVISEIYRNAMNIEPFSHRQITRSDNDHHFARNLSSVTCNSRELYDGRVVKALHFKSKRFIPRTFQYSKKNTLPIITSIAF